jgi:Flp pilus assembly protein TadD
LTESIINSLAQLQNLRVSPRSAVFQYKGKDTDPIKIAASLGVRAVLTGRLLQRGDKLMVSAELLDVRENKQVWGEQYDRKVSDALGVQQDISREISEKLRTKLTSEDQQRLERRGTNNPESYQYYLKGRYYWNRRTAVNIQKALEQFQQAVDKDPTYALAYVGLADSYALLEQYAGKPAVETLPKAKTAAQRALEIDDTLAEAHTSLGYINMFAWQFDEAEKEFRRGFELNPNYPTARQWYGIYLRIRGRSDEAMTETRRAQQLDPLSPIISVQVCNLYMLKGDLNTAASECNKVLELDSNFPRAHDLLGWSYLKQGRMQEALVELQKGAEYSGRASQELGYLGYGYGVMGNRTAALEILKELEERYAEQKTPAMFPAAVYAGLGDKDQAFAWLEKDFQAHSGALVYITYFPVYDTIRGDPRYADLLHRMGLDQ